MDKKSLKIVVKITSGSYFWNAQQDNTKTSGILVRLHNFKSSNRWDKLQQCSCFNWSLEDVLMFPNYPRRLE